MNLSTLPKDQQHEALELFREAVLHRVRQWEAERRLERLLGDGVNFDVAVWAVGIDDPDAPGAADMITLENLQQELDCNG